MNTEAEQIEDVSAGCSAMSGAMALHSGFKRTDAGVIPDDWDIARIDLHASIKTGGKNTQDKQEDGEYPFFVRSQEVERIDSYSYDGEAVLTAGDGVGTGKVFHYIVGRFDVHQRVYRIASFSERLDGLYFYFQFSTRFFDRIMSMTAKSSVDSVRMETIAGMQIPLPRFTEQRAIAEALSDVDGLLGSLEALITKKRAIKQAAIQQLLTGKTRLPGFGGEWTIKRFGKVFRRLNGKPHQIQTSEYGPHGRHPVIDQGQNLIVAFSDQTKKLFECPTGGVIVFGDHTRVVKFVDVDFLIGADGTQLLAMQERDVAKFFFYQLSTKDIPNTGYNRHFKFLKDLAFLIPTQTEQHAIAEVLSDMDAEIAALEQRWHKTGAVKQGMMQQLLTGRVRLVTSGEFPNG